MSTKMNGTCRLSAPPSLSRKLSMSRVVPRPFTSATARPLSRSPTTARASGTPATEKEIEGLDRNYCDDFECTSSPAVEQAVRTLAKDLELTRYSKSLFDRDVKFDDGFRQCTGPDNAIKQLWIKENVTKPKVRIIKMQMLDKSSAQVDWALAGDLKGNQVDIRFTTTITMNLLTGRITALKETWDLSKCSAPVAMLASGSRIAYSAKKASENAGDDLNKIGEKINSSLSSFDDQSQNYGDPTDPTKFFQQGNPNQDYINFALFVAIMYLVFRGFAETATL